MAAAMDVTTAQMVLSENVRMQWRAWQSYLHARMVLTSADGTALTPSAEPSFVRDTDTAAQLRTDAEAHIKMLTAEQRTLFDRQVVDVRGRIHEEMRLAHRNKGLREDGLLIDPDDLTRQALTRLLDACEGRGLVYPGMGDTPMPGEKTWYQISLGELNTVSDAMFALATDKGRASSSLRSTFVVIGGMLALLTVYLVTLNWPAAAASTAEAAVLVDATPSTRWATTRVTRTAPSGDQASSLVLGTGAGWASAPDQATLRDDQVYPVVVCLPMAQLADLTGLTLHGEGGVRDRRYQLATLAPAQPDMVLVACGSNPGTPRYGTLADTLPPVEQALGSAATLADGKQVALLAVTTQGQASGQGQIQLVLTVQGLAGDLIAMQPTILLETGETVATPQRVAGAETTATDTAQISYALSAADQSRTAIWSITDPGTGQVYRWRITIDPPLAADALLGQTLQISAVQAQRISPGQISIALTLVNQSNVPLTVTANDLTLSRGGGTLPTPVFASVTLVPGKARTVTLTVPLSTGQDLVLHLAGQSFEIRE